MDRTTVDRGHGAAGRGNSRISAAAELRGADVSAERRCSEEHLLSDELPDVLGSDHFGLDVIMGIGYEEGIDAQSAELISEWDYPNVGVVLGVTPMAGPDTVMLDYSESGPDGEPAVVYVGEDRIPRRVADSFGEFIDGLVSCEVYEDEDDDQ
nr:SMI1/KNR4 family protein [Micromonospora sp. ATA51]